MITSYVKRKVLVNLELFQMLFISNGEKESNFHKSIDNFFSEKLHITMFYFILHYAIIIIYSLTHFAPIKV